VLSGDLGNGPVIYDRSGLRSSFRQFNSDPGGTVLDGETAGPGVLPSGNGLEGGDFVMDF